MYLKSRFFYTLFFIFILIGLNACSVVPKTPKQVEVVTYSQIISTAEDANKAYTAGLITSSQHKLVHDNLIKVMALLNETNKTMEASNLLMETIQLIGKNND